MKFSNGRISRDRKRGAHEIAEGIALVKAVEEKKRLRRVQVIIKVSKVASYFIILINFLLLLDIYILTHKKYSSKITQATTTHSWYYYSSIPDLQITTANGSFWTIKNPRFETIDESITYVETPLFKLQYGIYSINQNKPMTRIYDAFRISKYVSVIFFALGIAGIALRPLTGNEYFAGFIIVLTAIQNILLLW